MNKEKLIEWIENELANTEESASQEELNEVINDILDKIKEYKLGGNLK